MDDQPHVFQSRLQGFAKRDKAPEVPVTLEAFSLRCPASLLRRFTDARLLCPRD
jgi:hypothetical protein